MAMAARVSPVLQKSSAFLKYFSPLPADPNNVPLPAAPRRPIVLAATLCLLGIPSLVGGIFLLVLGGSAYYAAAGLALLACASLLWARNPLGERLYAVFLLATLAWSLSESGLNFWALLPRLSLFALIGIWASLPSFLRGPPHRTGLAAVTGVLSLCVMLLALGMPRHNQYAPFPPLADGTQATQPDTDWPNYGNDPGGSRFAPLADINAGNVASLQVAWTFRSGEASLPKSASEATPLKIGDTLYSCTPGNQIFALDSRSGVLRWRFDPKIALGAYAIHTCRGVAYYAAPPGTADCPTRIITATIDARLFALDAASGTVCKGFGHAGFVSLKDGLGAVGQGQYGVTSPPTIVNAHVVIGALIPDNDALDMPSGVVRSFDPIDGHLQWAWDVGAPDRSGPPLPGQTYTRSTPNAWSIFSADPALGLVYIPTGNPSPDSWAQKRRDFDEKYLSSIVALDVATGRPRWSFQTVHHDLWDYDTSAQPSLIDFPTAEGARAALLQATKRSDIFVLDRRTGQPLLPTAERAVATGPMLPGEWASKTQPFSALSMPVPQLTESSLWGATFLDQLYCRIQFHHSRYEGMFTPPGTVPIIQMPGNTGSIDWGGISIDTDRHVLVANYMMLPWRGRLIPRAEVSADMQRTPLAGMMTGTPYAWDFKPWLGPLGVPCFQPPWGALTAIDLGTGRVLWDRPIGTAMDNGPFGLRSHVNLTIGVPSLSGTIVTRGGLIFISGTADQFVRAIETSTGRELWKARLPAGGQATPMTYMAGGHQYLLVTAGGQMLMQTTPGDYTIAYRLR
jgi:quinoprotein glucose dehydrogenase